jgi:Mg-chelatase subunit ChlD
MTNNAKTYLEQVTETPEAEVQLFLFQSGLAHKFDEANYQKAITDLAALEPDPSFAQEIKSVSYLTYNDTPQIKLDTQPRQLLWAATLLRQTALATQDQKNIADTPFFEAYKEHSVFRQELLRSAQALSEHFDRHKTAIRWGEPLSWFYYNPTDDFVNIDPYYSLVLGLPRHPQDHAHSRAASTHEVGHAVLTRDLPEPYQKIRDRVLELAEKNKEGKTLTPPEKDELLDKGIESMLWARFFNATEDNVVNRFATILGRHRYTQAEDYSESLKYLYAFLRKSEADMEDFKQDDWAKYSKQAKKTLNKIHGSSAYSQLQAIEHAIGSAAVINEGLFDNTKESWERFGLAWDDFMPNLKKDDEKLKALATILQECDGNKNSISYQQPYMMRAMQSAKHSGLLNLKAASEKFFKFLPSAQSKTLHLPSELREASELRNAIIVGMWDRYVLPLLPEIKKEVIDALNNDAPNSPNNNLPMPPRGGFLPMPGGSGGGKNKNGKENGNAKPGDQESESQKEIDEQGAEGESKKEDEHAEQDGGKGKEQQENADDNGGGQKPKGNIDKQSCNDPGEVIQDIIDKEAAKEQKEQKNQEESQKQQQQQLEKVVSRSTQEVRNKIDYDFPDGNWADYAAARTKLSGLITIVDRHLEEIRKKQIKHDAKQGQLLEMLPEGGETDRLDPLAQLYLAVRSEVAMPLQPEDFNRFHADKRTISYTTPQIVMLIDGSGSMGWRMDGSSGPTPIDIAISSGVVFHEGTSKINQRTKEPKPAYECYTGVWGPDNPTWLTDPKTNPINAGENFDRFRNGLQSNTNLAPALRMTAQKLSTPNSTAKTIGATHLIIISDGDIQDPATAREAASDLIKNVRNLTIDVVVVSSRYDKIEAMLRSLASKNKGFKYGVHHISAVEQMPIKCLTAVKKRMMDQIESTPISVKAAQFKRATLG